MSQETDFEMQPPVQHEDASVMSNRVSASHNLDCLFLFCHLLCSSWAKQRSHNPAAGHSTFILNIKTTEVVSLGYSDTFIYLLLIFFMLNLPNPPKWKKMWSGSFDSSWSVTKYSWSGALGREILLARIKGLKAHCYYHMLCGMVLFESLDTIGFSGDGFHF